MLSSAAFDKFCESEKFKGPIGVNQSTTNPVDDLTVLDWSTELE